MTTNTDTYHIRPASRIIRTIGKDLIKDAHAAVIELVKNSFDADSKSADIIIEYDSDKKCLKVSVIDFGHGMSLNTITDVWLVPATSDKYDRKKSPTGRQLQGRKGIGRYAAGVLGDVLLMESVDKELNLSKIIIDFEELEKEKFLSDVDILVESGEKGKESGVSIEVTTLKISADEVIKTWNPVQLQKLEVDLRKLKSPITKDQDDKFEITFEYKNLPYVKKHKGKQEEVIEYANKKVIVEPLPILDYFDYRVSGTVNHKGEAEVFYENQNIPNIKPERIKLQINLEENQSYCGLIKFDFRIFDRDPEAIDELLNRGLRELKIGKLEARKILDELYGIGIYRDIFRVRPYGDQDYDWLDLDKKRVQNPSMAIGMNQVVGFIEIQPEDESKLFEKSARDGLVESSHYAGLQFISNYLFSQVIQPKRFEFRKMIGRGRKVTGINDKLDDLFSFKTMQDKVSSQLVLLGISEENSQKVARIISDEEKKKQTLLKGVKNTIAVYQGQVTLGKLTEVLLHEGRKSLQYLREQLPRVNRWVDKYISKPNDELKEKILNRSQKSVFHANALSLLFKRIEPLSKGRLPNKKTTNIFSSIDQAAAIYESEISSKGIVFSNEIDVELEIFGREYDLVTAFANFFENSIYWLNKTSNNERLISLRSDEDAKKIVIELFDNGPGISEKYASLVFEPNFSLKDGGTGLGLPIAAEALKRSGGNVSIGKSDKGTVIYIEFVKGVGDA